MGGGYIALYGVAMQTGVVMVIHLHEALDKRLIRGADVTANDIREATCGFGAATATQTDDRESSHGGLSAHPLEHRSRLRHHEANRGASGMVKSTIHVLIITPVILYIMKVYALRKGTLKVSGMTL
jgi:Cu(I)/Ag(I) efflux system membrane protein CusA/SilA